MKEDHSYWIVSPVIAIEDNFQLSFDLALTKAAGGPVEPGAQNDDKFMVLVKEGNNIWEPLMQWKANYGTTFDDITDDAEGQSVKYDLHNFAGKTIQIALYGESTEANGDNNLHISNLKIDTIPACSNASKITIDAQPTTASIEWIADEGGV